MCAAPCALSLGVVAIFAYTKGGPQEVLPLSLLLLLGAGFIVFQLPLKGALDKYLQEYLVATSLFGVLCMAFRALFILAGKSGSETKEISAGAWQGLLGAGLVMAAGAVGIKGELRAGPLKMQAVDLFHYLMAVANVALVHFFQSLWQ